MLVVDSSAVIEALAVKRRDRELVERLAAATELHAPHLLDAEILHVLRTLVTAGELSPERAEDVLDDYAALRIRRHPHEPLAERAWELRRQLTTCDGIFVALAEKLEAPLVTCDARLASASGRTVQVELFGGSELGAVG